MDLKLRAIRAFYGPNVWSRHPITWVVLDANGRSVSEFDAFEHLQAEATALIDAFVDPTVSAKPQAPIWDGVSVGWADLVGRLAVNLQRRAGVAVEFSGWSPAAGPGLYEVAFQHRDASVGKGAIHVALSIVEFLTTGASEVDLNKEFVRQISGPASTWRQSMGGELIRAAAEKRGIPISRIDPRGGLLELGTGVYQQRFSGARTSRTPSLGDRIARDKSVTNAYLRAAGIPVPDGHVVRTPDEGVAAARKIGYPVVVKPVDGLGGFGVTLGLREEHDVRTYVAEVVAGSPGGTALVERHMTGRNYRVTVLAGQVPYVMEYQAATVTGDGVRSLRELIEEENRNPRRGVKQHDVLRLIKIDDRNEAYLRREGMTFATVPAAGEVVRVQEFPEVKNGGRSVNRTAATHPHNAALFVQAAQLLGLELANLDVVCEDIGTPMRAGTGAILEFNVGAAYTPEYYVVEGEPWDAGPAIVEMLFPPGAPVRVPVVVVVGDDVDELSGEIARRLAGFGTMVGLATPERLQVGEVELVRERTLDPSGARTVLANPATEVAVVAVSGREIVERGLPFGVCDAVVVAELSGLLTPAGQPAERVVINLIEDGGAVIVEKDDAALCTFAASMAPRLTVLTVPSEDLVHAVVTQVRVQPVDAE